MNHDIRNSRQAVLSWRCAGQGDPTRRGDRPTGRKVVTMTIGTGSNVRLNTPDNPRLHGSIATVEALTEWGAHVLAPAAATGRYRASDYEMEPLDDPPADSLSGEERVPGSPPLTQPTLVENAAPAPTGRRAKPVSGTRVGAVGKTRPAKDTDVMSPTGNLCHHCGSCRMVRSGACETCLDCGESGGCG